MELSLPADEFTEVYPVFLPEIQAVESVRGPGKYLWCAREVAKTLASGGEVWICSSSELIARRFSSLVERSAVVGGPVLKKSDKLRGNTDKVAGSGRRFFGDYSFSETVGLLLEKRRGEAADLLSPFISTEGFSFTPAEFLDLLGRLRGALRRYERLPAVSNALEDLNTGFFRHQSLEESTAIIKNHLDNYLERGADLHRRYLLSINAHARSRMIEMRKDLRLRDAALASLAGRIEAWGKGSGRGQRKALAELKTQWSDYLERYPAGNAGADKEVSAERLGREVARAREKLAEELQLLGRSLKTEGMSLSAITVEPTHGDAEELRRLEHQLNELLREVDEAGLYQLPLRLTDAATAPRQLQQLDGLLAKLRNTDRHLGELPLFYNRRHSWYAQPAHLRRLMAPLLDLPSSDWETAFSSWYFERCLERETSPERFYREIPRMAGNEVATQKKEQEPKPPINYLQPGAPWPEKAAADDLLLDLTGDGGLRTLQTAARKYTIAPLSDTSAMHLAVSGYRNPVLVFGQSFRLLHPPDWKMRRTENAPVVGKKGVLLQPTPDGDWISLADWDGETSGEMNVFLPETMNPEAEEALLAGWERLVSRATGITFFHPLGPDQITQGLLSDGFNARFLVSVLLRAAEAAEVRPFDHEALIALGKELRLRCGLPEPAPHPLALQFGKLLSEKLPDYFLEAHVPWRDTFLPLVAQSPAGKKTVLLPDGRLPGLADEATETARQRQLSVAGFGVLGLNALRIWENTEAELDRMALAIVGSAQRPS